MAHLLTESKHSLYAYDGQQLMPAPVAQVGPTCVLHAIAYGAQKALRHKMFKQFQKSYVVFNVLHYTYLYERETMVRILYDRSRRIKGAARVFQLYGVEIQREGANVEEPCCMCLPYFDSFPPTIDAVTGLPIPALEYDVVCNMIKAHKVVIGSFANDPGLERLHPDEIYDFVPKPGSRFDTHCVLFVDYGSYMGRKYLKFLNSRGPEFGDGGLGRVFFDRIFQTDDEFCFHTLSFDDDQACLKKKNDVPSYQLPPPASDATAVQPLVCPKSNHVMDDDPFSTKILDMRLEDQILGVVQFISELVWEDTEPTIGDSGVTKLCDDAHKHLLAGHWLDLASLILESADFYSLGVAQEELEGILALTCSLVTKAASEIEAMKIAKLIWTKLDQQLAYSPSLGLKILFNLHNLIANSCDKSLLQTKVFEYATACSSSEHVSNDFENIDDWCIHSSEQKKMFFEISEILRHQKG